MLKTIKSTAIMFLLILAVLTDGLIIDSNLNTSASYLYYMLALYFLICVVAGFIVVYRVANNPNKAFKKLAPMFVRISFFSLMICKVFLITPKNNILVNLAPALFIQIACMIDLKLAEHAAKIM